MFGDFPQPPDETVREAHWEGWTPPWAEHEKHWHGGGHGWRHHGWHGPRGPFFGPRRQWGPWGVPEELLALRIQAAEVGRLFAIASRGAFENKERLSQLRAFLDRSHKELAEIIYGPAQEQAKEAGEPTSGPPQSEEA